MELQGLKYGAHHTAFNAVPDRLIKEKIKYSDSSSQLAK